MDFFLWGFSTVARFGIGHVPIGLILGSAVLVFAALLFRRRRPRAVFVISWAYSLVWVALLRDYEPFTALMVSLYTIARHLTARAGAGFLVSTAVVWAVATTNSARTHPGPVPEMVAPAFVWCVITGIVWMAGRFGFRAEQDARVRAQMQATAAALALQDERLRLARDLHDAVSHSVVAMTLQAASARGSAITDADQVGRVLEEIQLAGTQAMGELGQLVRLLHGSTASPSPGLAEADALVRTLRSCGITTTWQTGGLPGTLSRPAEQAAYRILQESFTNVIKHAGRGAHVDVTLTWSTEALELLVRSTGGGTAASVLLPSSGFGLDGLEGRVHDVGGQLTSRPDPAGGFVVQAWLPVVAPGGPEHLEIPHVVLPLAETVPSARR